MVPETDAIAVPDEPLGSSLAPEVLPERRRPQLRSRRGSKQDRRPPNGAIRLLVHYVRPFRSRLAVLMGCMGVSVAMALLQPWPTKVLADGVLGDQGTPTWLGWLPGSGTPRGLLGWTALAVVAIFLLGSTFRTLEAVAGVQLSQRITFRVGGDLLRSLQQQSLLFHADHPIGDSLSRITKDAYAVQTIMTGVILPVTQAAITLVLMFIIMWGLEPVLTMVAIAVVPIMIFVIRRSSGQMRDASRKVADVEGQLASVLEHTLSAIPAVQAFSREGKQQREYERLSDEAVAAYSASTIAGMWFKLGVGLATALGTAAVIYVGGSYVLDGQLTLGSALIFLAYLAALYAPLNQIAYTAETIQGALARLDRVRETLDRVPDVVEWPHARAAELVGHVEFRDVWFGYQSSRTVLAGISFEAHPGETIALVGPTGVGKSTTLGLLVRFFDPWSGSVLIDGQDIRHLTLQSLRDQVAVVLQEPFVFPISVFDNIAYGRPNASREQVEQAAIAARADDFIQCLPNGYDTIIGERGSSLSGGEKQRLSIARAFLKDAPVLVLDEPTSALDPRTEEALLEAQAALRAGRTTLVIAHRLSTIERADTILVLDGGQVLERGSHDALLKAGGAYAAMQPRRRTPGSGSAGPRAVAARHPRGVRG